MDYRAKNFVHKFTNAQKHLGGSPQRIVSFKYRDGSYVDYSDYRRLINELSQSEAVLEVKQIEGKFQGDAWLIKDKNQNSAILVEHESGLEIISTIADIISLLGVFSLINSGWRFIRDRSARFSYDRDVQIEVRTLNSKNQVSEKHVINLESYVVEASLKEITALRTKVKKLEKKLAETKTKTNKKSPAKKAKRSAVSKSK